MTLDDEITLAMLELSLGLPDRCGCISADSYLNPYREALMCKMCGGLISTMEEIANAGLVR